MVDHKDVQLYKVNVFYEYLFLVNSWVISYDTIKTKEPWPTFRPTALTAFVFSFFVCHAYSTHTQNIH